MCSVIEVREKDIDNLVCGKIDNVLIGKTIRRRHSSDVECCIPGVQGRCHGI
jgi:hypothetical protein